MRKRRLAALPAAIAATIVAGSLVTASPASAYVLYGCKYSTYNLKWKAATTTSGYLSAAQASATAWLQTATPIILTQVNSGANITVANGNFGNMSTFDGIFQTGDRQVPTCGASGLWPVGLVTWWNTYYTDAYSGDKRQSVMVHEIGHALGLAHSSAATCANRPIMEPYTDRRYDICGHITPQWGDVDGINFLYL